MLDEGHKIRNSDTTMASKLQGIGASHRLSKWTTLQRTTWLDCFLQYSRGLPFTTTSESYGDSFIGCTPTSSRGPLGTFSTNHSIFPRVHILCHSSPLRRNSSKRSCSVERKPPWRCPSHPGKSSPCSFP